MSELHGKVTDGPVRPLVTVVVPCFNHETYIEAALDSVGAQTYPNIELIVIDDASVDGSAARIRAWEGSGRARGLRAVTLLVNPGNRGAPATINSGIERAQGRYVTILNSDDTYLPRRLESLVDAAEGSGAELLFSAVTTVDAHDRRCTEPGLSSDVESMGDYALAHPTISFALLKRNVCVTTGNLFFSAALARRIGGFRNLRYCHDWDFAVRAALHTEPVLVNEVLYRYRLHGDNSFKTLRFEQFLEPQIVYRSFFTRCRAGLCTNDQAPDPVHWEYFAENFFALGHYLKDAYRMTGQALPQLDTIAKMVRYNLSLPRP